VTQTTTTTEKRPAWGLRWLGLLALIGLLVGVNLLYQPAANWNTVQSGEPGELLYAAGFDGFTDEWTQYEGRRAAQITEGVLRMSLDAPDVIYSSAEPRFTDFDLQVTVRSVEGAETNDGYGVIFRLSEQSESATCARQFVIVCNLEQIPFLDTAIGLAAPAPQPQPEGYYVFLISNDGFYQVLRGNTETNQVEPVTIWHDSQGMLNTGIGAENTIRVVGEGNQFQFFLNGESAQLCIPNEGEQPTGNSLDCLGEETFVWEDDAYTNGQLGVILNGATQAGDIVEFDNFSVIFPREITIEGNNA